MKDKAALLETAESYENMLSRQKDLLRNLTLKILVESYDSAEETLEELSRLNEAHYLRLKSIIYDLRCQSGNAAADYDCIERLGKQALFPAYLKYESGIWKFHLPPMPSVKKVKRTASEGQAVFYSVMYLLEEYEREHHMRLSCLEEPVLYIRHNIRKDETEVFDADNVDTKRAIDAMQGYLLSDDNALYLTTITDGALADEDSCDMYLFEKSLFREILRGMKSGKATAGNVKS